MGCDITLFCEGFISSFGHKDKRWINIDYWYREDVWPKCNIVNDSGFTFDDLIENRRDYGLFYLLAGVRGSDKENSYLPISKAKGLPEQMDGLIKNYYKEFYEIDFSVEGADFYDASYLTLKELKDSGYGDVMRLKGWVKEKEYEKALEWWKRGLKYQLNFVDVKCNEWEHQGRVLKEWDGYLNLNLIYMIEKMEYLKEKRNIKNDEEIRIVFWFDN